MSNGIIGFCAETHYQNYKCANCGETMRATKMTNFYNHEIVEWDEKKVCPKCGFKSMKPLSWWGEPPKE